MNRFKQIMTYICHLHIMCNPNFKIIKPKKQSKKCKKTQELQVAQIQCAHWHNVGTKKKATSHDSRCHLHTLWYMYIVHNTLSVDS